MHTYARLPVAFSRGEGAWLYDDDGNRYLDAVSGIAVCSLGHAHPAVSAAVCSQAQTLVHTSNLYRIELQQQLGDKLTALAGMERVFFANSGAEANEAAIKLARLYGHNRGIDNPEIIVTDNSFHGRTLATLSATGNRKIQAGFEPLVAGFIRVSYNDMAALENVARHHHNVVAILVEPVQGEGGVNVPDTDYLDNIRALCDKHGWLMMLDEIQTGMCRTGQWFGFQHCHSSPDVMTLAKALGNGVPIGACLARGEAADILGPGSHGSTFGGNLLACAAATAVIDTMQEDNLAEYAAGMGRYFMDGFRQALGDKPYVTDIRGQGLLIGIELDRPCKELVQQALAQKLLINVTADKVIRLLPPLIVDKPQADSIIDTVTQLVNTFCEDAP
jgi:acetylornithine aminotransferase